MGAGGFSVLLRRIFDWGVGFLVDLWWLAMEDAYLDDAPVTIQRGFGRTGVGDAPVAAPYARLLRGLDRGGRSGTAPTRGLAVLR